MLCVYLTKYPSNEVIDSAHLAFQVCSGFTENTSIPKALTHLPLDQMAVISQSTMYWDAISRVNSFQSWLKISLEFVPRGSIDNNPTLV